MAGSAVTHGILIVILWGSLTLAAQPARRPAEVAASFDAPLTVEEPIPEVRPEPAPLPEELPTPTVLDEPVPEPDPFELHEPDFSPPELLLPPDHPVANIRRTPAPPRAAPPPPAPVAVTVPTGPTRLAEPAPGNPAPRYPELAIDRGIEGTVLLMVSVTPDGVVRDIEVKKSSGSSLLDREAVRTVTGWSFLPALRLGHRVASRVEVPIRFRFD
jgi:protein TonB